MKKILILMSVVMLSFSASADESRDELNRDLNQCAKVATENVERSVQQMEDDNRPVIVKRIGKGLATTANVVYLFVCTSVESADYLTEVTGVQRLVRVTGGVVLDIKDGVLNALDSLFHGLRNLFRR